MGAGSRLGAATSFFLARHRPLVVGLALTDACNLRCVHCRVANVGARRLSMAEIEALLLDLHARGARVLYLEGGEPYLWRDGAWTAASVVRRAREMGFLRVHVYTNGTMPLDAGPDFHWVSIDGPPSMHRRIRGFPVDATIEHLRAHAGPAAVITTLNTLNLGVIDETLDFVERELPGRRVMFYFHTPYYGFDELLPSPAQRAAAAEHIVELKHAGRPVLNSAAGIRATASGRFRHPLPYVAVVDATGEYRCCRAIGAPEVCRHCGYSACAELELVRHLHPGALREALRYV